MAAAAPLATLMLAVERQAIHVDRVEPGAGALSQVGGQPVAHRVLAGRLMM